MCRSTKPGSHDQPRCVDDLIGIGVEPSDGGDAPVADADVADEATVAQSVDDRAAPDDGVETSHDSTPPVRIPDNMFGIVAV